ncbi:GNAT family protein [Streptomyces sp. NPDC051940]|uniref:GNAT family N-acetyltransferase n=1 Tax=Streptomyces sp. NPDC051940 TaxID=3155675 RepID=UPI00344AB83A
MTTLARKPTLRGPHVTLVPIEARHAPEFLAMGDDPDLFRLTGSHIRHDAETIHRWCASRAGQPDRLDLAVEDRGTGDFLGELALLRVDPHNESAAFRIALREDRCGKGIGSEAIGLVLGHAFGEVGLHRVWLEVFAFNHRAIRAYEKAGFVREGVQREALLWDGVRHDAYLMSVLRRDHDR